MATFQPNDIRETTRDLTEAGHDRAADAATRASDALDSASSSIGRGVERAGDAIKSVTRSAGTSLADMRRSIQSADLSEMGNDLIAMLRRNPTATFCAGLGAGILVAQMLRPRYR